LQSKNSIQTEVSTRTTVSAIPTFPQSFGVGGKSNFTLKLNQLLDFSPPNKIFQDFVDGLGLRSCPRFFLHDSQHVIVDIQGGPHHMLHAYKFSETVCSAKHII
jgi:hypothetical protein